MTEVEIEAVACAISSVNLFSRFNDWASDAVPGLPVEICRYGDEAMGEPEIVVVNRLAETVSERNALHNEVRRARAIAALKAMGK